MRPVEKRDGVGGSSGPDTRVGRHRAKLDEIRESLKAYEHESTAESSSRTYDGETRRNGNISTVPSGYPIEEMMRMMPSSSTNYRFEMQSIPVSNNNMTQISPIFQRPPPPAYDATPQSNTKRVTPVPVDNYRTHLHIKTQPHSKLPPSHHKMMAPPPPPPPPPAKSTVCIETNVNDEILKNDNIHRLYHTSLDKKSTNSVVCINVASPLTTKVNVGFTPISSEPFRMGSRFPSDADRTKILLNYTDELRRDPRLIPSTSNNDFQPILFKPPNLDITFQSRHSAGHSSVKRSSSPIDRSLLDAYLKTNNRKTQPCKPSMFRFYMEQHVERLLQQYRERERRMRQLEKEMNAANLPEIMRERMLELLQQKESRYTRLRRQKMSKNHFIIISHIGIGAFGKVSLVRKKDTGKVYAMKSLEKADVIIKQQAAHVKAERDILAEADSPWIVRLFFSFQDESCLYFIMEYVPGGDMMSLLIQKGIFEESLARFYIAELTCAIEYVHSVGFIHRDIKPDNILIDQQGHIKLTDFGLCTGLRWTHDRRFYMPENEHQRVDSLTVAADVAAMDKSAKVLNERQKNRRMVAKSMVGTASYMAPEVFACSGHNQLCDWWSMGVILYEMVFGRVPFHSEVEGETKMRILHWRNYLDLSYGTHLSRECLLMVQQLVCDAENRLGSSGGAKQIKNHVWFKGLNFERLRKSRAEYIPQVMSDEDTSNFDTFEINDKTEKPVRALNNPAFYEFTYRHFFDTDSAGCPSLRPAQRRRSLRPVFENGIFEESANVSEDDSASHV